MGPRSIDIDILLYGPHVLTASKLTVPHPRLEERQFALLPLLELEPHLCSPISGEPYRRALQRLDDQGVYYYASFSYTVHR